MSVTETDSTAPPAVEAATDALNRPKVPLTRLVRVELRKMVDTRAGVWLFAAMGLITAAAVVLYLLFAPEQAQSYWGFVGVTVTPQGFLLPVLGILLITSEWGQRTGLGTFTLEPRRGLVVLAKIIAAVLIGLAAVAILMGVAAGGTALAGALDSGAGAWDVGGREVGNVVLLQLLAILQGLAFGLLLLNSAAAIVLYFVLPIAFNILFTFIEQLRDIAPWLDLATAQQPLFMDQAMTGEQWAHLAVTTALWVGLPMLLGLLRLQRAEIKTA